MGEGKRHGEPAAVTGASQEEGRRLVQNCWVLTSQWFELD